MSNRTKEIIEVIIQQKGYIKVSEITQLLGISQRTVYRELPEITRIMQEHGMTLESVSRKGLLAVGSPQALEHLKKTLNQQKTVLIVNPEQRADYILLYLLNEKEFIKTEAIAIDHQCALTTVRADLVKIQEKVANYDLQVIQQKGQGVLINGKSIEKNHLIADILLEWVDETIFYEWLNSQKDVSDPFLGRIEEYGYREILNHVHCVVQKMIEQDLNKVNQFKTRDYLEMVLLLSFMLSCHGTEYQYRQYMESELKPKYKEWAKNIEKCISEKFSIELTQEEQTYVQWIVLVCSARGEHTITTIRDQVLNKEIMKFIQFVENKIGIYLVRDRQLREGLYAHMDKALVRIRSNMQIINPALKEIKKDYGELFDVIKEGTRLIFKDDYFPEDEIAYLVLYFAVSLDKIVKKSFRVIVVCSGGMGSSKMLANTLEKEIPEINIVKTASIVALRQERLEDYDLILSTIPLTLPEDQYLKVSPLLHENELLLIREKIQRHKHNMLKKIDLREKENRKNDKNDKVLQDVKKISTLAVHIINNFKIIEYPECQNTRKEIDSSLKIFQNNMEQIELLKDYAFTIPTTNVIFYEGIYKNMEKPYLFLHKYQGFQYVIVMTYSDDMESCEKKVLRYLIQCIIEDIDFVGSLNKENKESIVNWIGGQIINYLKEII